MTIDTMRLRLSPFSPAHLLALIEGEEVFKERCGVALAPGSAIFSWPAKFSRNGSKCFNPSLLPTRGCTGLPCCTPKMKKLSAARASRGPPTKLALSRLLMASCRLIGARDMRPRPRRDWSNSRWNTGRFASFAHTLPENNASAHVLKKCGFDFVGEVVDPEDGRIWRWERAVAAVPA